MLNNLTNFFNLIRGRKIKAIPSDSDLIPLGTRDSRYDGSYQPTGITVEDFVQAVGEPSVVFTEGVVDPQVQATMSPLWGTITNSNGDVYDKYRIQGVATLTGNSSYAYLIGVVVGSDNILRVKEDTTVYDTVASAMNFSVLVKNGVGALVSTTSAFIADDNTISASEDHWFTLVMTAAVPFEAEVIIDFTIAVPQGAVIQFFN